MDIQPAQHDTSRIARAAQNQLRSGVGSGVRYPAQGGTPRFGLLALSLPGSSLCQSASTGKRKMDRLLVTSSYRTCTPYTVSVGRPASVPLICRDAPAPV